MKLKKGDNVIVMAGKDQGLTGKVLKVLPTENRLVIDGVNLIKRRTRPKKAGEKGQVVQVAYPITAAKVMFKCSRCNRGVRVGYRLGGKSKVRVCRRCGSEL